MPLIIYSTNLLACTTSTAIAAGVTAGVAAIVTTVLVITLRTQTCLAGTYLKDKECLPCASGYWQNETQKLTCMACPVDMYQNATGAKVCIECPVGHMNEVAGAAS